MKPVLLITIGLTALLLAGCYKDNFRERHPSIPSSGASTCDTTAAISYSAQVAPIINSYCINCHGAGATSPDLSTYSGVQASAQSNLYSSISWDGTVSPMPQGSSTQIPLCDRRQIRKWIDQGMPK